jgi:hypothetical protein
MVQIATSVAFGAYVIKKNSRSKNFVYIVRGPVVLIKVVRIDHYCRLIFNSTTS